MKYKLKIFGFQCLMFMAIVIFFYQLNKYHSYKQTGTKHQDFPVKFSYNETFDPCKMKIIVPNFYIPGRRISEEKCLELIWKIKKFKWKNEECKKYRQNRVNLDIIGGYVTKPGDYSHMGAVGWRAGKVGWIFKCGATIISSNFMVTAGHCTKSGRDIRIINQKPEIVRIGTNNLLRRHYFMDVKIQRIMTHPNFHPPQQYYDIALIKLESEITFNTKIQPACLLNDFNTIDFGEKVVATGWGVTEIGRRMFSPQLRAADLYIFNNSFCNDLLHSMCNRRWCGLRDHQVCAGKLSGGVDACNGDSGGPLQVRIKDTPLETKLYYLLGVTSFGFGCARADAPGVYTRVSSFIDWIEQIVWREDIARRKNEILT